MLKFKNFIGNTSGFQDEDDILLFDDLVSEVRVEPEKKRADELFHVVCLGSLASQGKKMDNVGLLGLAVVLVGYGYASLSQYFCVVFLAQVAGKLVVVPVGVDRFFGQTFEICIGRWEF